jgi:transposase
MMHILCKKDMRRTQKPPLQCSEEQKSRLETLAKSRTAPWREVQRAGILLKYMEGNTITAIAEHFGTNRPLVERCLNKALAFGVERGLKDLSGRGVKAKITDDARSWVLSIACQSPVTLGYAQETWTYSLLKEHIRQNCKEAGYGMLSRIDKGVLHGILEKGKIKPHKISYYLEKRDEQFDVKMAEVLHVYKQVEITNALDLSDRAITTISYDEKPGIQAIQNIAAQLLPVPGGTYPTIQRDYEYKRLGTLSLLAGIDLHTGIIIPLVRDRHRSLEFIEFLTEVDKQYPEDWLIRIVLDNHSSHVSKETQAYLKTRLGRFEFIFTPKHGSWLNMIEMFFSKLTRSVLRHIRVQSKAELKSRIYQGIAAFNNDPVVFAWKYKMDGVNVK